MAWNFDISALNRRGVNPSSANGALSGGLMSQGSYGPPQGVPTFAAVPPTRPMPMPMPMPGGGGLMGQGRYGGWGSALGGMMGRGGPQGPGRMDPGQYASTGWPIRPPQMDQPAGRGQGSPLQQDIQMAQRPGGAAGPGGRGGGPSDVGQQFGGGGNPRLESLRQRMGPERFQQMQQNASQVATGQGQPQGTAEAERAANYGGTQLQEHRRRGFGGFLNRAVGKAIQNAPGAPGKGMVQGLVNKGPAGQVTRQNHRGQQNQNMTASTVNYGRPFRGRGGG